MSDSGPDKSSPETQRGVTSRHVCGSKWVARRLSFAAVGADAVDFEEVALELEVELGCQLLGKLVGHALLEFDDGVAMVADEMVVAAPGHEDEMGGAGALVDRADDAAGAEQVQGAVDGHAADLGRLAPDGGRQGVGGDVPFALGQRRDDCFTRGRQAVSAVNDGLAQEFDVVTHRTSRWAPAPKDAPAGR